MKPKNFGNIESVASWKKKV